MLTVETINGQAFLRLSDEQLMALMESTRTARNQAFKAERVLVRIGEG